MNATNEGAMKLTKMEVVVLKAMDQSARSNGYDFGFIEDCRPAVASPRSLAGVVSSLVKKGVITVHEAAYTDSGRWTQFTFRIPVQQVGALVDAAQAKPVEAAPADLAALPLTTAIKVPASITEELKSYFSMTPEDQRVSLARLNLRIETMKLRQAFDLVAPKPDWKAPIDTFITDAQLAEAGVDLEAVREAVIHYTATVPTFSRVGFSPNGVKVEAAGYHAGPAGG